MGQTGNITPTKPGTNPRFLTPIVTLAENSETAVNYR